jgi:hypothetical protein
MLSVVQMVTTVIQTASSNLPCGLAPLSGLMHLHGTRELLVMQMLHQVGDIEGLSHGQLRALYKNKTLKLNLGSNFKPLNFSGRKRSGLTERWRVTRTVQRRHTLRTEH